MKIAIHLDYFKEIMFEETIVSRRNSLLTILFNPQNSFITTKKYFDQIESECNDENIKSILHELIDLDKIEIVNNATNHEEEYLNILANQNRFDLALSCKAEIPLNNAVILVKAKDFNIHEIGKFLLERSYLNVSHLNFKTNNQLDNFIKSLFSISSNTTKVSVFDRDKCSKFLDFFKGRRIEYYTFYRKNSVDFNYKSDDLKKLKASLGGKLNFYYTHNSKLLHERKIILGSLLITFDNSRNNIEVTEPTWEIYVNNDSQKATDWMNKCSLFRP